MGSASSANLVAAGGRGQWSSETARQGCEDGGAVERLVNFSWLGVEVTVITTCDHCRTGYLPRIRSRVSRWV